MKKFSLILVLILIVFSVNLNVFASESGASFGNVPQSAATAAVDGAKDAIYDSALAIPVARASDSTPLPDGCTDSAVAYVLYSGEDLYIFVNIKDSDIVAPDPDKQANAPWETDSFEVFINASNSDDGTETMQYRIDTSGWPCIYNQAGLADYGPDMVKTQFGYGQKSVAGGYDVEFKIPVGKLNEGTKLGFNLQINDVFSDGTAQCILYPATSLNGASWDAENYDYVTIGAMIVETAPPVVVEEPAAPVETAAPVVIVAAQTGDTGIYLLSLACAAAVILKKRLSK